MNLDVSPLTMNSITTGRQVSRRLAKRVIQIGNDEFNCDYARDQVVNMKFLIAVYVLLRVVALVNSCRSSDTRVDALNATCLHCNCSELNLLITIKSTSVSLNFTQADYESREFHRTLHQLGDCDDIFRSESASHYADHAVLLSFCNDTVGGHLLLNNAINEIYLDQDLNYCLHQVSQLINNAIDANFRTIPSPVAKKRYLELVLINDNAVYTYFSENTDSIMKFNRKLITMINVMYAKLDINLVLRKVLVWSQFDQITADNVTIALQQFTRYVDEHLRRLEHFDVALLLSGLYHNSTTVGEAYKGTVCSKRGITQSLSINVTSSPSLQLPV